MDEEIDRIPLIGVDFVKAHFETVGMQGDGADEGSKSQDYFCLQIATNPEGYNSGRTYTFRTYSKELYDEVLPFLTKLFKKAKRRARANTVFRKCQWQVKKVYSNNICQSIMAVVIMGVSRLGTIPPAPCAPTARAHCAIRQSFACTIVETIVN